MAAHLPAMFAQDPVDHLGQAHPVVIDTFAGLLVAAAVADPAGIGERQADCAAAEHEATDKHAGTRRNAQGRHPHLLLIPVEIVAD
ncbi:hypothetical protein DVS77_32235 [Mycolicibacterium moriokaense]|nr:hypothetical protein DVS77_32235 [Mycolicibacterium moriokaense]